MKVDYALYSKRLVTPNGVIEGTILVGDGKIQDVVSGNIPNPAFAIEDLGDLVIMPGLIDSHVHINEPGRTEWEGFEYATKAAAAGGITTLIDMPLNSSPVTISGGALKKKIEASRGKLFVHCGFWGGLVPSNAESLEGLLEAGVLGIKGFLVHSGLDEFPSVAEEDLRKGIPIIQKYQVPFLAHAELDLAGGYMAELETHPRNYRAYLHSRPDQWEEDAIELLIKLCREYDCKTHVVHLSSVRPLGMIRNAKASGIPLTFETK